MKTRKHNLKTIVVGVALAMGSMAALAAATPPPVAHPAEPGGAAIIAAERASAKPTFNSNERVGLCLVESVVSMLAARTNDFSCGKANYDLSVYTEDPTTGYAELDGGVDVGGTTLKATLTTKDIGARCKVDEVAGLNLLKTTQLTDYNGTHGWSRTNEIFNSDASIKIKDRQTGSENWYREVNIKDFYKRVITGRSWEFDHGVEDIKKYRSGSTPDFYYPVSKWAELSWYRHENGGEGGLWVNKAVIVPRSAYGCQIKVEGLDVWNGMGEFEVNGTVRVGFGI